MLLLALLAAQAATDQAPADIELNLHATVREVRIRQRGETSLEVRASPDANSRVVVTRPPGNQNARNATVDVHAEARIAAPQTNSQPPETSRPN
jgi:hypothetical protein